MAARRLSVIVPTHNKAERLALTLCALSAQSLPSDAFEVIVVADGCTDRTPEILAEAGGSELKLRVFETPHIGQAGARNFGVGAAKGEILVFVDDDVLLSPNYLSVCADLSAEAKRVVRASVYLLRYLAVFRDPERGIPYDLPVDRLSGSRLLDELVSRTRIREDWDWIAARCRHLNRFERLVRDCLIATPQRYSWIGYSGSGVAVPRRIFYDAGGYNEMFGLRWGAEALELGYRLKRSGVSFEHLSEVYSAHMDHPRGTSIDTFEQSFDLFYDAYRDPEIREVERLIMAGDRKPVSRAS